MASDIFGASSRAMIEALIGGQRDANPLVDLAVGRLRHKLPALQHALAARFDDHRGFLAGMLLRHIDTTIGEMDTRIGIEIAPYRAEVELLDTIEPLPS